MKFWMGWLGIELSVVSYKEKIVSGLGGFVSMLALILISERCLQFPGAVPLVASMGASAVLLFAVPHGQLSQPWPVFGGHVLSALIGVTCAKCVSHPAVAAALAVSVAIGVMHQFKCIHPPGGATALTAVLGGPAVQALGYKFVLCPVAINAATMIAIAVLFNAFFGWRRYPAFLNRRAPSLMPSAQQKEPTHEEVVEALRSLDSFVDITEDDLIRLSRILTSSRRSPQKAKRLLEEFAQV